MKKCILGLLLLFMYGIGNGQAYKYRFRMIDLPEAFKNEYITWVDEDAAGMLWFVTNTGLHRYDGNQVLTFDLQSTPALPDIDIGLLVADGRNHLWIGTAGKLVCFDLQHWTIRTVPFQNAAATLQNQVLTAITEGDDGTIYAGFGNLNLFRVTRDSLEFITHIKKPAGDTTPGECYINIIREPAPGHLLLTTSNGEVITMKHRQTIFAPPVYCRQQQSGNVTRHVSGINPVSQYLVYVPVNGPCMVDLERAIVTPLVSSAGMPSLQKSEVYIAGLGGSQAMFFYKHPETVMLIYDPLKNTFENLTNVYPATFKNNKPRCITYKNGHILIPSKGGIATVSYANSALDMFTASLESINSIRTIYKEPTGHLLIGSYLHGFIEFDEDSSTQKTIDGQLVSCLLPWQKDTLLAGTEGGGLAWYLPATNSLLPLFNATDANRLLVNPYTICITRESDTSFWVGTLAGFILVNPYSKRSLNSSLPEEGQRIQQLKVYDILKVGHARFFATREGLFKYDVPGKSWTKLLTTADGNLENSYFTCVRLAKNQLWAGTVGNGMLVLDTAGNLIRKITTADGLAGNIIFSNPLWKSYILAGTRTGLSIIDIHSGKISNYASEYYLPANEFNRSAWCVNGDTVYLGTINGFIRIDMGRLEQQQNAATPGICFSSITRSNGRSSQCDYTLPYRKNLSLTIPPDVNNFSIGFGGISELGDGVKLYYRLTADGPWQEIGQRREVTFVNTAPNNYTMQIAGRLPDDRWMDNLLTLPITVQPYFYQTLWWKTLVCLVIMALMWLGIKYREKALLKEQELRSRIAGDLHDEVGSALTRIYIQAGMRSTPDGKDNVQPREALQQIASSSQEALSSMSDMVWSIDANYDNAPDMVDRIRDYIARLQDELDRSYTLNVSGNFERLRLSQAVRQNVLLIFKEAMNNAVKYGSDDLVAVSLILNENVLQLEVTNKLPAKEADNIVQGGHGLKSMRLRAAKIKAQLYITHTSSEFVVRLLGKPF